MPAVGRPQVSLDAGPQLLRPVVVLGSPGSGLTAMLGMLVSELRESKLEHLRLREPDPHSLQYMLERRGELDHGQWPETTGSAIDPHRFAIAYDDGVLQLVLRLDVRRYPGPEAADTYYDALVKHASAVFFLVDPQTVPTDGAGGADWERCLETARRLRAALDRHGGRKTGLRVGVILTKVDVYHDRQDDLQTIRRTVRAAFRGLHKAVRHLRVFLVSATGSYSLPVETAGEKAPPAYPLQSHNLGNPWAWHCHTYIQDRLRTWKAASVAVACAVAALVMFLLVRDHVDYHRVLGYVRSHSGPRHHSAILQRCQEYLRAHPWGHYRHDVQTLVTGIHHDQEDRQWQETLDATPSGAGGYAAVRAAYEAYLNAYPKGRYREQAETAIERAWLHEEKQDWMDLLVGYRDKPLDVFEQSVRAYLKKWPELDSHAVHRPDVLLLWNTAKTKDEQTVWAQVRAHEQTHPGDVAGTLAQYESYLQRVRKKLLPGRFAESARAKVLALRLRLAARAYEEAVRQADMKRSAAARLAVYDTFLTSYPKHPHAQAIRALAREVRSPPAAAQWDTLERYRAEHAQQFEQVAQHMKTYADQHGQALRRTRWGRQQLHEIAQLGAWLESVQSIRTYKVTLVDGQAGHHTGDTDFFVVVYVDRRQVLSTESVRFAAGTFRPAWSRTFDVPWRLDVPLAVEVWEKDTWPDANDRIGKLVAVPHGPAPAGVAVLRDRVTMKALCGTHTLFWGRRDRPFRITFRSDFRDLDQWLSDHPFDEPPPGLSAPTTRTR